MGSARQHGLRATRPRPECGAGKIAGAGHELIRVDDLGLKGLLARKGQQPAGQCSRARRALQGHLLGARHARDRSRRRQFGQQPADHVEAAEHDGEKIVEVMGDAAGELTDGFHFLRLPERFLDLLVSLVFRFQRPRAFPDGLFEAFGEVAKLDQLALARRDVDADADDSDWLSCFVVEWQAPRMDPAQLVVAWANDAKFELEFPHLRFESRCDRIAESGHVLAVYKWRSNCRTGRQIP